MKNAEERLQKILCSRPAILSEMRCHPCQHWNRCLRPASSSLCSLRDGSDTVSQALLAKTQFAARNFTYLPVTLGPVRKFSQMHLPIRLFEVLRKFRTLINTNTVENSLDACANLFVSLLLLVVNCSTRRFTPNVRIAIFLVMYARRTVLSLSDTSSASEFRMLSSASL